jgi:Sigma-70 region 2
VTPASSEPSGVGPESELRQQFEALALPHLRAVYGLAFRLTGDRATAEDLAQVTFLKAFKAFGNLRDTDRVRPWLFQILSRLDGRWPESRWRPSSSTSTTAWTVATGFNSAASWMSS